LVHLPNSYQVNNNSQKISSKKFKRSDFGLPQKSFVFACFNGTYKIEPELFDIWVRLLKKVPGSVLWLLKTSGIAETNLKNEAKKRGVDPKRLIFSGRLTKEKHLKRLALADLALDTFTCNGHTTTSDCLWAGVPVVTKIGKHFASRVSASLLTAVGLPELITKTPEEYEKLILSLSKAPERLKKIRMSLNANCSSSPLFDTEKFSNNLEKAYTQIWKNYQAGRKPKTITIND
jgi:predicted O-linked N-acetylglucosamine transferase (SPINDLY family)